MKHPGRLFKWLLTAVLTVSFAFTAAADALDDYILYLNRIETSFWRGIFSQSNSGSRAALVRNLEELNRIGISIQTMRRNHNINTAAGDLAAPASELRYLVTSHSAFRKVGSITGIKRTTLEEFSKVMRRKQGSRRNVVITEKDISPDDYRAFLSDVCNTNLETIHRKYRSNRDLSTSQREKLTKTAEKYFSIITRIRLNILMLRQKDPLFQRIKNKSVTGK